MRKDIFYDPRPMENDFFQGLVLLNKTYDLGFEICPEDNNGEVLIFCGGEKPVASKLKDGRFLIYAYEPDISQKPIENLVRFGDYYPRFDDIESLWRRDKKTGLYERVNGPFKLDI